MKTLIFLFIIIGIGLLGCSNQKIKDTKEVIDVSKGDVSKPIEERSKSQAQKFELYQGKPLHIAILGEIPKVKEENIRFTRISFRNLKREKLTSYDAVFVMEDTFSEASSSQYSEVYLNSTIPYFFISANSYIPFIVSSTEFSPSWKWEPGKNYAVGVINNPSKDKLNFWGFGLYNDKKTQEHIEEVYSRIFKVIEELSQ
ncbi:hypothetical protein Q7A53_19090 [Halobacillus rhizosphaerae]|uniref:hypothetical protein n=1 Tax=Halobacillus rhizosphaerae TaxID=3064889 RepID=UPI00398B7A65